MNVQEVVIAVMAGGGSAALVTFAKGFFDWVTGRAGRERDKNADLATLKKNAEKDRDVADVKRREAEEHVSILKRQLREHGIDPHDRPEEE